MLDWPTREKKKIEKKIKKIKIILKIQISAKEKFPEDRSGCWGRKQNKATKENKLKIDKIIIITTNTN